MNIRKKWISALLLQSSVPHDPSEIILICWDVAQWLLIIIENQLMLLNGSASHFLQKY